jgi:hypothetical protein
LESAWDHEQVNDQRVELLCADPATAPHAHGALVIDDTGDRKDGTATAHVARASSHGGAPAQLGTALDDRPALQADCCEPAARERRSGLGRAVQRPLTWGGAEGI